MRWLFGILALTSLTALAEVGEGGDDSLPLSPQASRMVWQVEAGDHLPDLAALLYPGQPAIQAFWLKKVHEFNPLVPIDLPVLTTQALWIPEPAWLANQAIPKIASRIKQSARPAARYDQLQKRKDALQQALVETLQQQAQLERQLDDLRQRLQHMAEAAPDSKANAAESLAASPIIKTPKPIQLPEGQRQRHYKVLDHHQQQPAVPVPSLWQMFLRYWLLGLVLLIGLASIGGSIWLAVSHKRQIALRQQAALQAHAELTRPELAWSSSAKTADENAQISAKRPTKVDSPCAEVLAKSADLLQVGQANQALLVLEDWVTHAPTQSVFPWLYLLACNETMQRMEAFSEVVEQMHHAFGLVHTVSSHRLGDSEPRVQPALAHIRAELNQIWMGQDIGLQLPAEMPNNPASARARQGFSVAVLREVTVLQALLELQSGY